MNDSVSITNFIFECDRCGGRTFNELVLCCIEDDEYSICEACEYELIPVLRAFISAKRC